MFRQSGEREALVLLLRMSIKSSLAVVLAISSIALGACHHNPPVASTTTHTDTTTQDSSGDVKKTDSTTTVTDHQDGTQTTKTTGSVETSTPPSGH
jgi:hypothetical protein